MPERRHLRRLWWWALCASAVAGAQPTQAGPAQDYMLQCMGCHGTHAEGVPGKVPPLAHALARFMRSSAGRNYVLRVPGAANSMLSDAQLADVLNWLVQQYDANELSGGIAPFTTEEVTSLRHQPLASVLAARRAAVAELATTGPAPGSDY